MFCTSCGTEIADGAGTCPQCGASVSGRSGQTGNTTEIPNHLVGSILATIFCCMPFGIPAIVYAAQVNSRVAAGDLEGATQASQKAKTWMLVSIGVGLVSSLFYIIATLLPAVSAAIQAANAAA